MFFSKNEQPIIETFYKHVSGLNKDDILQLIWKSAKVQAVFDTCYDDYNEDDESDSYTSFVFKMIDSAGCPPIDLGENDYFIVNYHNFPEKIILNGEIIN